MALRILTSLALVGAIGLLPACGDDTKETAEDSATSGSPTGNTEPTTDTPTGGTGAAEDGPICTNLGGQAGVEAVIGSFLGKVLADDKINAYFLRSDLDAGKLSGCLSTQVGEAVGCAGIVYGCMDMKTVHAGMGISTQDFNDLAGDFVAAMDEVPALTKEDKDTVAGVLVGMLGDIVEDPDNNETIYQRVGRKPGIATVIGGPTDPKSFVALVAGDMTLLPFFATSDLNRLKTCLVRQVTGATVGDSVPLNGIYGKEVTAPDGIDPGVTADKPCRDMVSSHKDLKAGGVGIAKADFDALVGHLVTAMTNYSVSMDDQNAIGGVLGSLCSSIVTVDPEMCPPGP
jgi:hemoglobin